VLILLRSSQLVEQPRIDGFLEARPELADEGDLLLDSHKRDHLVDSPQHTLLSVRCGLGVEGAPFDLGLASFDYLDDLAPVGGDDLVDLSAQLVSGLLELRHLAPTEGVRVSQRRTDNGVAAGGQVAEIAAVGTQEVGGIVVDDLLATTEEGLDRVDRALLDIEQLVATA